MDTTLPDRAEKAAKRNVSNNAMLADAATPTRAQSRLDSVDLLRGIVMVLMALDHVRDFFSNSTFGPLDLARTNEALFLTRWVTHFCAPVFVLLAGTGAFLSLSQGNPVSRALPASSASPTPQSRVASAQSADAAHAPSVRHTGQSGAGEARARDILREAQTGRTPSTCVAQGKTKSELTRFLLTRGLWLVLLELTVVRFGWMFNLDYSYTFVQVIWALGWSMVALAGLVFLPTWAVTLFGIVMIAGHNLFDGAPPDGLGAWSWLWTILHSPGSLRPWPGIEVYVLYPLVPWIGVMAAGYGLGALLLREQSERRKWLIALGVALTSAFVVLRVTNVYGDPRPWSPQKNLVFAIFSFINCEKYPPSLLYLLMTLGPALVALGLFDRKPGMLARPFVIFGRVPLFYYLIHLPLIHALAVVLAQARYGQVAWLFGPPSRSRTFGYDLPIVYLVWTGVVLALLPLCRWFARVKQRRRDGWLSYL